MLPTSMTRCAGSMRIYAAYPTASPEDLSRIAKNKGSSEPTFCLRCKSKSARLTNGPSKRYSHRCSFFPPHAPSKSASACAKGSSGTTLTMRPSSVVRCGRLAELALTGAPTEVISPSDLEAIPVFHCVEVKQPRLRTPKTDLRPPDTADLNPQAPKPDIPETIFCLP